MQAVTHIKAFLLHFAEAATHNLLTGKRSTPVITDGTLASADTIIPPSQSLVVPSALISSSLPLPALPQAPTLSPSRLNNVPSQSRPPRLVSEPQAIAKRAKGTLLAPLQRLHHQNHQKMNVPRVVERSGMGKAPNVHLAFSCVQIKFPVHRCSVSHNVLESNGKR